MRAQFERIYETNFWGNGSGEGSAPLHTKGYVRFLERFIRRNDIKSVVDFGCGDWQFSRHIDWNGADYAGFDIVRSVVKANRERFQHANVTFHLAPDDFDALPSADLILIKDVLQHWSNAAIHEFLPTLKRYRYALITNCVGILPRRFWRGRQDFDNTDIEDGDFRRLDLRKAPFFLDAEEVYSFTRGDRWPWEIEHWRKVTLLARGSS